MITTKLSQVKLTVGEEVWGCTAPQITVLNTIYQETTSIKRCAPRHYEVSCGSRADGTGWKKYCKTMSAAIKIAGFDPESEISGERIKTSFDKD